MGTTSDDEVKQKILDLLAEEPTMVLSTAYVYAKNYVEYGEDITKAWTTAVQQASVLQEVRQKTWVEAYDDFKADYENRLKADLVDMITELSMKIGEIEDGYVEFDEENKRSLSMIPLESVERLIDEEINSLKETSDEVS